MHLSHQDVPTHCVTPAECVALVGIGNSVAGDDGAGLEALRRVEERWSHDPRVSFHALHGDLYAVADLLPLAGRFLFLDAACGDTPGQVVIASEVPPGNAPSFHQADVAAVMHVLERLRLAEPFPKWEIWGVTIDPPSELRIGLSPAVERGVGELVEKLDAWLRAR